jgi:hypothetical protein
VAGARPGAAGQEIAGQAAPGLYVAVELAGDGQGGGPGLPYAPLAQAIVRAAAAGAALAAITAPQAVWHIHRCYRGRG